jgi:Ni/Co efflux regulator RcnB
MKRISLLIALFGLLFIVLPSLTAQDEKKKDAEKADAKKNEAKKDESKTTDDPEKKKEKHKDEPKKEKLNYSYMKPGKIISVNGRDVTVEIKEVDPKKQQDVASWQAQRTQQLAQQNAQATQQYNQALTQKDANARATAIQNALKARANYTSDLAKFNIELAKKDIYSPKPWDVHAQDDAKVRTMILPVEFDDLGFEKKWTKKEIEERKDKTGLPGSFATDFDQLKSGQLVDVYIAKTAKDKDKDQPKKKKGPDDDPVPEVKTRAEFILIVIRQQPAPPK